MKLKATPRQDNKSVGERSEAVILARFVEPGFKVFCPWGENHRIDMLIEDEDENLYRIQCKTGRVYRECVRFNTVSSYAHHRKGGREIIEGRLTISLFTCRKFRSIIWFLWTLLAQKKVFCVWRQGISRKNMYTEQRNMRCRGRREPVKGFEPPASGLQNRCSTTELHRLVDWMHNYL